MDTSMKLPARLIYFDQWVYSTSIQRMMLHQKLERLLPQLRRGSSHKASKKALWTYLFLFDASRRRYSSAKRARVAPAAHENRREGLRAMASSGDAEAKSFIKSKWIANQMKDRSSQFTTQGEIKLFVGTWNVNGTYLGTQSVSPDSSFCINQARSPILTRTCELGFKLKVHRRRLKN